MNLLEFLALLQSVFFIPCIIYATIKLTVSKPSKTISKHEIVRIIDENNSRNTQFIVAGLNRMLDEKIDTLKQQFRDEISEFRGEIKTKIEEIQKE